MTVPPRALVAPCQRATLPSRRCPYSAVEKDKSVRTPQPDSSRSRQLPLRSGRERLERGGSGQMFAVLLSLAAGPSVSQYGQGSQDDGTHPRSLTGERVDTTDNSH